MGAAAFIWSFGVEGRYTVGTHMTVKETVTDTFTRNIESPIYQYQHTARRAGSEGMGGG